MIHAAPARHVRGHLLWTYQGSIWATWEVTPRTYQYLSHLEKKAFWQATTRALNRLPRHWMVLSLCAAIDPAAVIEDTLDGVDVDATPQLRDKTLAELDLLEGLELYERHYYLACQLPLAGQGWRPAAAATAANLQRLFGLTPPPPRVGDWQAAAAAAAKLEAAIGAHLPLRRLSESEQVWMMTRFPRRGLDEPLLAEYRDQPGLPGPAAGIDPGRVLAGPCLAAVNDQATYFEGGGGRSARELTSLPRFLRVQVPPLDGAGPDQVGHQTFVVQHGLPKEFRMPGSEWFSAAETVPFAVDWVVSGQSVPNTDAVRRNQTAKKHLVGQHEQWDGSETGMPVELDQAHDGIEAEEAALAEDRSAPELEITALFSAWHEDRVECQRRGEVLTQLLTDGEYQAVRPVGRQEECYWATWPGAELGGLHRAYRQWLMPADLAAFVPFAGAELGDPTGALFGFSLDGAVARPVLLDPTRGTRLAHRRSGNICLLGDLGAGKSYAMKRLAEQTIDRGGRIIALDRTSRAEWSSWAAAVASHPAVVQLTGGGYCFDPLRVFTGDARIRYATGYLTQLTGYEPRSLQGTLLKQAVKAVAAAGGRIHDVLGELDTASDDRAAREVAERLRSVLDDDLAGIVFGDGQVPDLDEHDVVVFACPELNLPSREDQATEFGRRHLADEQIHSLALLYLITAVARHAAFDHVTRFTALAVDEGWVLDGNAEGQALYEALLRDGSKHHCGVWVSSQTVETFPQQLLDLFSRWMVFRSAHRAAERTLSALGIDADPWLPERFEQLDAGQCLLSDLTRRVGLIQVCEPALEEHRWAVRTDYEAALHAQQQQQQPAPAALDHVGPTLPDPEAKPPAGR